MPASPPSTASVRYWTIAVIVLLVAALAVWWYVQRPGATGSATGPDRPLDHPAAEGGPGAIGGGGEVEPADAEIRERERQWEALLGSQPEWPGDLNVPADCEEVERSMRQVCRALEARPYLHRQEDLCGLLREAAEEAASRPPTLTSELGSHEAVVGNVFHLFRVLGKERMGTLRRLLREENELAEPLAMAVYRWLVSRESCSMGESPVTSDALYDYASFLFTTMGGQAYMRRRSPPVEALACFYALQAVDGAVARDHNPWGVDPRPEITRCRRLAAGQPFVFRDRYTAALDAMERSWARRGERP